MHDGSLGTNKCVPNCIKFVLPLEVMPKICRNVKPSETHFAHFEVANWCVCVCVCVCACVRACVNLTIVTEYVIKCILKLLTICV